MNQEPQAVTAIERFRQLALSFPNAEEYPHFDRRAFRIKGKRTFATLHEASETVNVMLSPLDQSVFCLFDKDAVYPVPNKWGLKGATTFVLSKAPEEMLRDAIEAALTLLPLPNAGGIPRSSAP